MHKNNRPPAGLRGFCHGVTATMQTWGRRVIGHQDQRPAVVAGLGAPAETACPQPHSFSGYAESLAGLGIGLPVRHAVKPRASNRLIGWLTGWLIGRAVGHGS